MVMGPGENAGAVDVGDGLAVAFKVESHNHPSAVEPFQGAATGVGGILRDVFAIGARPIAMLDSLRFGELDSRALALPARPRGGRASATTATRSAWPPSAARSTSRRRYEQNCLVNAMCVGIAPQRAADPQRGRRRRATSSCCWARSPAATGSAAPRCSPAPSSARTTPPSGPTVQIGDPFEEKKLLECCLELLDARAARVAPGPGRGGPAPRARPRWRRRARSASTSTCRACRCARTTWSRSRS